MSVESIVTEYGDMLFRICLVMLCNEQDAQDVVQDTFCRYMEHAPVFCGAEHEKAWLIKVASNRCKDLYRGRMRHPTVNMEEISGYCEMPEQSELLVQLMRLPERLKSVIYLYYIEGYKTEEIAQMLGITANAVKKRMQRGRKRLRLSMGQ